MNLRVIETATNAELDRLALSNDRQKLLKFKFRLLQEMSREPSAKDWLVKGIVVLRETSAWIAPPGGMKSALLGELAFAVASNVDWHGHRIKKTGAVVYFALERADLVNRRLQAYLARASEDSDAPPIAVVSAMIDLMKAATVPDVVASIRAVEAETGLPVVLIIFDTFAKLVAAGGGDENKASDQGAVFANIQRIKDEIGCHVALIGHTGKDETKGSRGSNAILGDVDVMVTISGDSIKTAAVIKANDAPEGPLFSFKSETHEFGTDEDGDPITVNVVSTEEVSAIEVKKKSKWAKGLQLVQSCLIEALMQEGELHQVAGAGPYVKAVSVQTARAIHNKRYVSSGDGNRAEAERKAWARNFKTAREANLIGGESVNDRELIWMVA